MAQSAPVPVEIEYKGKTYKGSRADAHMSRSGTIEEIYAMAELFREIRVEFHTVGRAPMATFCVSTLGLVALMMLAVFALW